MEEEPIQASPPEVMPVSVYEEKKSPTKDEVLRHPRAVSAGTANLDHEDMKDIESALVAVESISDTFMASKSKTEPSEQEFPSEVPEAPKVRINLEESEEIIASTKSYATRPSLATEKSIPIAVQPDEKEMPEVALDEAEASQDYKIPGEQEIAIVLQPPSIPEISWMQSLK